MTGIEFILKHGFLMIDFAIKPALLQRELDYSDDDGDMDEAWKALGIVEEIAYDVGARKTCFDLDAFILLYPEYSNVAANARHEGWMSIQIHDEDDCCIS